MGDAEKKLDELLRTLRAYARSGRPESMAALRDILQDMDKASALERMGCDRDCPRCAWEAKDAGPLENHCVFYAFLEALEDAGYAGRRGNAHMQKLAAGMLEILGRFPKPTPAG